MQQIQTQLKDILETGHTILERLNQEKPELAEIKALYDERGRQMENLTDNETENVRLSESQAKELRDLFTRIQLLEKRINKIFAKLSLQYGDSLKEIGLQKEAKESYAPIKTTGKFFDAQING
jgi:hypothetical protein